MAITDSSIQHSDGQSDTNAQINLNPESIDFDECFKDSPKYRHCLKENLAYVENLEHYMSKALKQITNYIESGREHIKSQRDLVHSMKTLNNLLGPSDKDSAKHVCTLLETLEEVMNLYGIVIDQSARTIGSSFSKFINEDVHNLKEARRSFDKISSEHDQALVKYSQPLKKQQEDSENILIATSTAFTHTSLDLSIQLTSLQSKKGSEILEPLLSFTRAHSTFFHQGYDLFEDLKPHISDMDEFLVNSLDSYESLTRNLPSNHLLVSNNELRRLCFDAQAAKVHLEGYLFKRASNGFKVWNRRWFILKDHQLLYQRRSDTQPIVMEEDVRLLTVRPIDKTDTERRFCFEVVSPHKSHILQASSEFACKTWMSAIQASINAAFHDTEHKLLPKTVLNEPTSSQSACTSWSANFSLKALQLQATNKFNSITSSIPGDSSKSDSKAQGMKDKDSNSKHSGVSGVLSGDEDDEHDGSCVNDGRAYARLSNDDEAESRPVSRNSDKIDHVKSIPVYPIPAPANADTQSNIDAPEKPQRAYMKILAMPGNDKCADCDASRPRWASINLGITLCIECAGIHRSLGVHLSKVRSLTLDTEVWSPVIVDLMLSLGNSTVNSAYLACYRNQTPPITADSSREERESWIKQKYLLKTFMRPPGMSLDDSTISSEAASPGETVVEQTFAASDETLKQVQSNVDHSKNHSNNDV